MILDATTKTIEVVLEGAITTNQLDVTAGFADSYPGGGFLPAESDTSTNGATPVTAVAAPPANVQRMVNEIRVYNKDTVTHTVTIQLNDNGTRRVLQKQTAAAGTVVLYSPAGGNMQNIATLDYVELESSSSPVKISAMADLNLSGPPSSATKISAEAGGTTNLGIQLDTLFELFVNWLNYIAVNPLDGNPGLPIVLTAGSALSGNNNGADIQLVPGIGKGSGTNGALRAVFAAATVGSNTKGGNVDIEAGTGDGTGAGGTLYIQSGFGGDSGTGGPVNFVAGDGGATAGDGGFFEVDAGMANSPTGTGGRVTFRAGDGLGANGVGGLIQFVAGTGNGTGAGGAVSLTSGGANASGNSGAVTLASGNSTSGNSGDINITIGTAGGTPGNVKFTGTWTANGAVATAVTGVGPTGSHTTVQEWFTVKNASGTVRYIPAF